LVSLLAVPGFWSAARECPAPSAPKEERKSDK
jgi:hypothetical protein